MARSRHASLKRWLIMTLAVVTVLVIAGIAAMHFAARSLKDNILEALGPQSEIGELTVGFTSIEILDVRIKAPKGWPSDSTLSAKRIVIVPNIRHLLSDEIEILTIDVENAYISALRPKGGGGLRMLPSITEKTKKDKTSDGKRRSATVGTVNFDRCVIEVFDQSVITKTQRVRFDAVKGTVKDLEVPALESQTKFDLAGVIKGINRHGTIAVRGWTKIANKSSELTLQVRNVDLALFEPYLVHKAKAGVESGTFNLDLKSIVQNNKLKANGTLTINSLKLKASDTPLSALANAPRRAAIGAMDNERKEISVPFNLEGDLDNPAFSISASTSLRTGIAFIKAFGFSFEGIVRAFLIIINGLGGGFGSALSK